MEAGALPRPRPGRGLTLRSRRLLGTLTDERLVEQIRRGNDAAFEVVYDRHSGAILSFCRHMVGSLEEAEDAVQHTFIAAYNDLLVNDRPIKLRAWLYTIARNRCLSMLRARREQAVEEIEVSTVGLADQVQERQDLRELLADMRELPDDQRAALVLAEIGDLPHADIAEVLGVEAAKVKSLVFQARSNLIENRDARAIPCHEIREQLSTLSGGALRRGPLRKHLKACAGCRDFREDVKRQRAMMAAVLPVIPTIGLKHSALAALGIGGGGGAAAAGGAAAGGGILTGLGSAGVATKAAIVLAVGGAAVGGGVAVDHAVTSSPPSSPPSSVEQGTTHRSPVGAGHAQGPPPSTPAQPGTHSGTPSTNATGGVARRVRAHGAPVTKHHGTTHSNNGLGPVHVPAANGHANQQSSSGSHSNSGHGNSGKPSSGGNGGKSSSGGKESHTSAGSRSHGIPAHVPASSQQSQGTASGTASTGSLLGVHGNSVHVHGNPHPVPPGQATLTPAP
ncbi:MAG: sigma-70 family RNA polymerase sigma factor [Gaiellaceae bacterium]